MKTALDVVIAFKGDCEDMDASEFIFLGVGGEFLVESQSNGAKHNQKMFVCTGDKVSALVDELASNFGKCNISYQKHCSNEVTRLEGNEMKTVLGAVIEFKGKWPFSTGFMCMPSGDNDVATQGRMKPADSKHTNEYWVNVCSRNEFNALVDELASNFGKCDISYQEYKDQYEFNKEAVRVMEELPVKTVTHEGKVYQIGGSYEFSDDGTDWLLGTLSGCTDKESNGTRYSFQYKNGNETEWFKRIRLQQAPIGTITEAPVKLVDGECYRFDYDGGEEFGRYRSSLALFCTGSNAYSAKYCTNIKPLTVD